MIFPVRLILLYTLLATIPVIAQDKLPPILDYYPDCEYQVVERVKVKVSTEHPADNNTKDELLTKIRMKALSAKADAVILIDKNIKKKIGARHGKVSSYLASFEGELIKLCKQQVNQKIKYNNPTAYDHQGNRVVKSNGLSTTIETKFEFTPPIKAQLNHPKIHNTELSLANGLYGITLGSSSQQINNVLGDPSIVLTVYKDELVLGYGRNHWLHMREDKLVKISSQLPLLSPSLINQVPLRDFFDEIQWKIENKAVRHSTLAEVMSAIDADTQLETNKELVIKGQASTLILRFRYNSAVKEKSKAYTLDHFSLQANSYTQAVINLENKRKRQFAVLTSLLGDLKQGKVVDFKLLSDSLGQPIGRITLSATSYVDVFNSNLLVGSNQSELASLQLVEGVFNLASNGAKTTPWFIGDFTQGTSLKQLEKYFPEDYFELDNSVEIDTDVFQLTLHFDDEDNGSSLYEAEIKIY